MATTIIKNTDSFDLSSLDTALQLPTGTTAERPTSPTTGEWRFNTDVNYIEFWDGGFWRECSGAPIPAQSFETVTYTGNGSTQSISSLPFSPSFVWIKRIDASASHFLTFEKIDTGKQWSTNSCAGRTFNTNMITSFDSNGFTLGDNANVNTNGGSFVAWCFNINGGVGVSNTDGSNTTNVEVNNLSKISILTYSGTGSSGTTVGHGLGVAPEFLFTRDQNNANCWWIWHKDLAPISGNNYLQFSSSSQASDTSIWNGTVPDDEVITLGNNASVNGSGRAMVTFAMASVDGFSKVSSYTGNGSANGPVINTGFQPAFILVKGSTVASQWNIIDNKRDTTNPASHKLYANLSNAEATADSLNFLSNGFQIITTDGGYNANGATYIYIAFASDGSAAPVLADSFANKLYTGTGSTQSITGLGFSPNFSWFKSRSNATSNVLHDTVRGPLSRIFSNSSAAASTIADGFVSFDSDGFTLDGTGSGGDVNTSGRTYVAWNWKANPMPTINTDGTIQSVVSANQAAGISIVKYEGNSTSGATIGHGLSAVPQIIIVKRLETPNDNWAVYNETIGNTKRLSLDESGAAASNRLEWNSTTPSATTFTLGNHSSVNQSSSYIAYCFHSVSGYSKISSYTGNGSAGHAITGLGFQPDFILIKGITSADNWFIFDSARGDSVTLNPNLSAAEYADTGVTSFDSDGFTLGSGAGENRNGDTYIYMAIKENLTPMPLAGNMSFLVIAGGGGGGGNSNSGGGGAGGLRTSTRGGSGGGSSSENDITLAAGTYTITVGAGGTTGQVLGGSGVASSIAASGLTTISSVGGGGGAGQTGNIAGANGGSGGGGGYNNQAGGTGTVNQGFAGGTGSPSGDYPAGGGGGAAEAGNTDGTGHGGDGLSVEITGAAVFYAGGASGGVSGGGTQIPGSQGGGGAGAEGNNQAPVAGTTNLGSGGGGGAADTVGAAGGSGVVILRLATAEYSGTTTGSPTVTTDSTYTILTYTGSGTYVHS